MTTKIPKKNEINDKNVIEDVIHIPNYPKKLSIYLRDNSKYYQVKYFTQNTEIRKSTKCVNKSDAILFAKNFYEEIIIKERNRHPLINSRKRNFEECAMMMLQEQEYLIKQKLRNVKLNINDRNIINKHILPEFSKHNIQDIKYKHINDFYQTLITNELSTSTIKTYLSVLHKIFNVALKNELIENIPTFPRLQQKDVPRPNFTTEEYRILKQKTRELIKQKIKVRYVPLTEEIRYVITFMINTLLRPTDIKNLKHRNIQIIEERFTYLRIYTDRSKSSNYPVSSMPVAVKIYKTLVNNHKNRNLPTDPESYVFFPEYLNRDYALQTMRRQFDYILDICKLKKTPDNNVRTLYSLRHTAIMMRLLNSENLDILTLARNARTTVEMIERFYARPLSAEMNIEKFQSIKKK